MTTMMTLALGSSTLGATMQFPSGAEVTLPDGVSGIARGHHLQFSIGADQLEIHIVEKEAGLEDAIAQVRAELFPSEHRKPMYSMAPPENGWDATAVEIYGPDHEEKMLQLLGKKKGDLVWVVAIRGIHGLLDKRMAQVTMLVQSLKVPGQEMLDLSTLPSISIKEKDGQLEAFIRQAMTQVEIPGLAIAIVEDGKVAYAQGFGVRNIVSQEPVDTDTRFMIGSTSKPLTTFLISKLADEGTLSWDDRVVDLAPEFMLKDPELSRKLILKNLVSTSTGIPRHDLPMIFTHTGKNAASLMTELKYLEQTTKQGETFQYNNQLVGAAGFIAAHKARPDLDTNQAYDQLMQEKVFGPIGMTRTTARFDDVVAQDNFAQCYKRNYQGGMQAVDFKFERFAEYVGPAGGIWSTVSDMAKYAITELNKGVTSEGQRVISEKNLTLRREKQVSITKDLDYGLAWMVGKNTGLKMVGHGGGTMGFISEFTFFPELNRAIIIQSNSSNAGFAHPALVSKILELWFGQDLKSSELLDSNLKMATQTLTAIKDNAFDLTPDYMKPFLGEHFNEEIGQMTISVEGASFFVSIGGNKFKVTGYRESSGAERLMIVDLPFMGFTIEPVFSATASVKMAHGQESYEFQARLPHAAD